MKLELKVSMAAFVPDAFGSGKANVKVVYVTKYNHAVLATNFGDPKVLQM
jgi:hypothetical protein